jgi:hypothetical protein
MTNILNLLNNSGVIFPPLASEILAEFSPIYSLTPQRIVFDDAFPLSGGKGKKTQTDPFP